MIEPPSDRRKLVISFDDEPSPPLPPAPEDPPDLDVSLRKAPAERDTEAPVPPVAVAPPPPPPSYETPLPAVPTSPAPRDLWPPPTPHGAGGPAYAPWGRRAAALMIDGLIIFVAAILMTTIFIAIFFASGDEGMGIILGYLFFLLFQMVAAAVYYPALLARTGARNGQTLGKQVMGIRVRHASGVPVSVGHAVLREVVLRQFVIGGIGSFFVFLPVLLDMLWPLWDDENRSLHDLGATTIVTRELA